MTVKYWNLGASAIYGNDTAAVFSATRCGALATIRAVLVSASEHAFSPLEVHARVSMRARPPELYQFRITDERVVLHASDITLQADGARGELHARSARRYLSPAPLAIDPDTALVVRVRRGTFDHRGGPDDVVVVLELEVEHELDVSRLEVLS